MNKQVKAGISAVRDFLSGRSGEAKVADPEDTATREVVAAELMATMSGGESENRTEASEKSGEPESLSPEQERARQLFVDHGYFDEAIQKLRAGTQAAERAEAARALGLVGSQRGTAHLIAAMFDDDPEVRSAAEEALARIGDPMVTKRPAAETHEESAVAPSGETDREPHEASGSRVSEEQAEQDVEAAHVSRKSATEQASAQSSSSSRKASSGGKTTVRDKSGRFVHVDSDDNEKQKQAPALGQIETQPSPEGEQLEAMADSGAAVPPTEAVTKAETDPEEEQLLLEEHAVRETVEQLETQLVEVTRVLKESENQIQWRIEREAKLRNDAATRHREEEEARKQADEDAKLRRLEEIQAIEAEQTARLESESEAQRLAQEEAKLRSEATRLRMAAEELARHRAEMEKARHEMAEAARHAEAVRLREEAQQRHDDEVGKLRAEEEGLRTAAEEAALRRSAVEAAREEAELEIARLTEERAQLETAQAARRAESERIRREEERNRAEQEQLAVQAEALRQVGEEVAQRRAEVEAAREKADKDAERLLETQARMKAAEEAREKAEIERRQVEEEINQRVEAEMRALAEARQRAQEEQVRMEEESRRQAEAEKLRLAEVQAMLKRAEAESKERSTQEQHIRSQLDSLRIADSEARKRIEDAEVKRRASEEAYRLAAEKLQRVEAEAHAAAAEEERMLSKLESERRSVANEAQARAEQEKRIRDEIEMLRRLEEQERPRIEEAILQRAAAEALLLQQRERLEAEEEIRLRAEEQYRQLSQAAAEKPRVEAPVLEQPVPSVAELDSDDEDQRSSAVLSSDITEDITEEIPVMPTAPVTGVPPAIALYLNSVDPYKRAAAVAELARSHSKEAYATIVDCFDDHSAHVRNAAARALRKLEPTKSVDLFNRALEEASDERRRNIGSAIAASGLATEAIENLVSESREETYNALSILFVMAKTGEVQPLVDAVEEHHNEEVRGAVIKLLNLSNNSDLAEAALKRRANGVSARQ